MVVMLNSVYVCPHDWFERSASSRGAALSLDGWRGSHSTVALLVLAASHWPEPAPVAFPALPVVKTTRRILVIDDEEMILSVVGSILNALGYECAMAKDGVEGCNEYVRAKADGKPFGAVLLDATIPNGLAGEEALKFLIESGSGSPRDPLHRLRGQ